MRIKTSNFKDKEEFFQWVGKHGNDYYREYKDKVIDWRTELDDGSYTVKRFNGVAFKPNTIYLVKNWSKSYLDQGYDISNYFFYYWRPNFIKSNLYYNPKYYTPHEGSLIRVDGSGGGYNIPQTVEQISMKWIEIPKTIFLNWDSNSNPLDENLK
tara:strand:+ start:2347 stop:2811 length:465 start_codon:yes stop_codon:yes gene_type:complete